jgi:serine phosphatase RsbU (regulator of sigma subunit)
MSLRLRLIVAFFALSVLPLGAVTLFTYASNVKAVQEAAAREADLLAGELTQRMQLVTAQLSERVEHLMDLPSPSTEPATKTPATPTKTPAAPTKPAATTAGAGTSVSTDEMNTQFAKALGEAAMLLNNVELSGFRPPGDSRQGRGSARAGQATGAGGAAGAPNTFGGRGRGDRGGGRGAGQGAGVAPRPSATATTPPVTSANPLPPTAPVVPQSPAAGTSVRPDVPRLSAAGRAEPPHIGGAPPGPGGPPPSPPGGFDPSRRGGPAPPGAPGDLPRPLTGASGDTSGGLHIDIAPIRRQVFQQLMPQGTFENLTQEERQRLTREVNQRLTGIMQGIQLGAAAGAAELQKKAADAQRAADAQAKAAETAQAAAKSAPQAAAEAAQAPLKRRTALSGTRLDVRMEQDGNVVQQANAELNLQSVLETVFSTTRTDRGEVPFAVAKDGHVYTQTDADRKKVEGLGAALKPEGPPTSTTISGDWIVVTTADPSGSGLRFGIAHPVGDSMDALRRTAARNASFGLLFIGLAIVGIVPLSGRLTRNLSTLIEGVGKIAQGDLRARVPVRSHDEIGRLAGAFNQMAADVERHQHAAVEQERIRRELELGRQIQHEMLPRRPMHLGLTEVQGVSVPAREVGGDFFNYFEVGDGQIALLVGDVSGKGVGAALLMANIQASLRTRLSLGRDLSAIADAIDHDIEENSPGAVYATLFVGILDPAARRLRYVNAGHHPQYVLRRKGGLERMASTGMPVGLFAGRGYTERQVQLDAGDVIFFYTDGCVEAENAAGDMFGSDRLEALLTSSPVENPAEVLRRVEAAVTGFRGGVEPFDDETMMAVRVG